VLEATVGASKENIEEPNKDDKFSIGFFST
jgi:hypothetical protein